MSKRNFEIVDGVVITDAPAQADASGRLTAAMPWDRSIKRRRRGPGGNFDFVEHDAATAAALNRDLRERRARERRRK